MSELLLSLLYIYTHHITPYMYIYICIYILYICSYPLATYINSHWAGNDNGWAVIFVSRLSSVLRSTDAEAAVSWDPPVICGISTNNFDGYYGLLWIRLWITY